MWTRVLSSLALVGVSWAFLSAQQELKIVVIAGEDAVNIIQQKTAVAPIVEVRDRNDNPVVGAVVTFSIQGGQNATFGGSLQSLIVTTNAAGRAAVTGLTPTASGAVQINVAATFQGQAAAATITQTNVLTAAQAAAGVSGTGATGNAVGGAGSGSGGGSPTTLGVIGGAVAAAAVSLVAIRGEDAAASAPPPSPLAGTWTARVSDTAPLVFGGPPYCFYSMNFSNIVATLTIGNSAAISGGSVTLLAAEQAVPPCPFSVGPPSDHTYLVSQGSVSGDAVSIQYAWQTGYPRATLTFTGTVSGKQIVGTFLWHRVDQGPPLDWTVTQSASLVQQ